MEEMNTRTTPCEVRKFNGDTYPSELFGIFQYSDSQGSKPIAVVKHQNGTICTVDVEAVRLIPAPYVQKKDGTRVYIEM